MAEIFGLVASIVTISKTLYYGIETAKTLYQTVDDLRCLQDELQDFSELMVNLENLHFDKSFNIVEPALIRVKFTIEQICQIIQVKILKNKNGSWRARKRAWFRNRSRLMRLRDSLRESKNELSIAMSANSSYAALPIL